MENIKDKQPSEVRHNYVHLYMRWDAWVYTA